MNRFVALLLSVLLPLEQAPQNRDQPSGNATVTVRLDGKGSLGLLATADRLDVEKYEKELRCAGLTCEEIAVLVADEIQVRIAAAKAGPAQPSATPPSVFQDPGMGPYVRALVMQGVRGRNLAAAINAERARRQTAAGQVKRPPKDSAATPAKAPVRSSVKVSPASKSSAPVPDRKAAPNEESRPTATGNPKVVAPPPATAESRPASPEA